MPPPALTDGYTAQISLYQTGDLAESTVTNTVHFINTAPFVEKPDYDSLAEDLCELWFTTLPVLFNTVECRIYNIQDEKPRPIRGQHIRQFTGSTLGDMGPREVALCLSYFSEQNLPRRRGRLYIGPWTSSEMNKRPDTNIVQTLLELGEGLTNIGGTNIQWCVYSPTDDEWRQVSHYWVDNEWDTVRSRGLTATGRVTIAAEG